MSPLQNSQVQGCRVAQCAADPSCATKPRGTKEPPAVSTLGCVGKPAARAGARSADCLPPRAQSRRAGTLGEQENHTSALTFRNSPDCGLVMGIKDVYVVAGRDRGGNLITIE